jgi:hypothetical protein
MACDTQRDSDSPSSASGSKADDLSDCEVLEDYTDCNDVDLDTCLEIGVNQQACCNDSPTYLYCDGIGGGDTDGSEGGTELDPCGEIESALDECMWEGGDLENCAGNLDPDLKQACCDFDGSHQACMAERFCDEARGLCVDECGAEAGECFESCLFEIGPGCAGV